MLSAVTISSFLSAANSGITNKLTKNTMYVIAVVIPLMIKSSCTVWDNFSLSSRTFAQARTP